MTEGYFWNMIIALIIAVVLYFAIVDIIAFFADKISLKVIKKTIGKDVESQINKKHYKSIFVFTKISHFIGIFSMFIMFAVASDDFSIATFLLVIYRIVTEPITNPQATPFFIATIGIAIVANLIFNFFIVFRTVTFSNTKRIISALIVSILTAPYLYLFGINIT